MTFNLIQVAYHRNGVSGDPFYAVLFESDIGELVACVPAHIFKDDGELRAAVKIAPPPCYVLQVGPVAEHKVTAGVASVRGDHFFESICEAIKEWSDDGRAFNHSDVPDDEDALLGAPSGDRSRPSMLTVDRAGR